MASTYEQFAMRDGPAAADAGCGRAAAGGEAPVTSRRELRLAVALAAVAGLVLGFLLAFPVYVYGFPGSQTCANQEPTRSTESDKPQASHVSGGFQEKSAPCVADGGSGGPQAGHVINTPGREPQQIPTTCIPDGGSEVCPSYFHCAGKPRDCHEVLLLNPDADSGVYRICQGDTGHEVYCDMDTDGGGWLVFQRRATGCVDFFRGWSDYASGFGQPPCEFWLGNRLLHDITRRKTYELRVDLVDFENETAHAAYSTFRVGPESDHFRLSVHGYSGDAGASLSGHTNMEFSTWDADHDNSTGNCANSYKGAWWYKACHASNLNGLYLLGNHTSHANGVNWSSWRGQYHSMRMTEMKIRPH